MTDTKPQIQGAQQITQDKYQNLHLVILYQMQKIKDKGKLLKEAKEGGSLTYRETKIVLHWISFQKPCKQEENSIKYLSLKREREIKKFLRQPWLDSSVG